MTKVALALMLIAASALAHAQSGIKLSNRQLSVGVGKQYINYYEYDNYGVTGGGWLDSETGSQPSLQASYSTQGEAFGLSDVYFSATYSYARGETRYDGYLQDIDTGSLSPYQTDTRVTSHDVQLKLGKGFSFFSDKSLQLTPYVSYGYRQWERDLSRDAFGYLEVYEHNAYGAGLLTQVAITPKLIASFDATIGRTFHAQMQLEDSTNFNLGEELIQSYMVGIDYALSTHWHLNGSYRITKFRYGESPVVGNFYEPESKSTIKTFYLGAGYSF